MIEVIIVIAVVAAAAGFAANSFYRTLTGKDEKRSCGCGKCTCKTLENSNFSCADKHIIEGKETQ